MKTTTAAPTTTHICRNCGSTIEYINPRGAAGFSGWVHAYGNDVWCGYEQITRAQKLIVR